MIQQVEKFVKACRVIDDKNKFRKQLLIMPVQLLFIDEKKKKKQELI